MIPTIQPDETLPSFIQRVLHLSGLHHDDLQLRRILSARGNSAPAKAVATFLKWPGCYGFNRVLHHHTWHPIDGIFNDGHDISYSQKRYGQRTCMGTHWQRKNAYCPSCVREDLEKLGFSYWRRAHEGDVTVCWKHNTVLLTSCGVCDAPITPSSIGKPLQTGSYNFTGKLTTSVAPHSGHGLEIMWEGCLQKTLGEAVAEVNSDGTALRKARFYNDVLNYGYLIPLEPALRSMQRKFYELKLQGIIFNSVCEGDFRAQRHILNRLDMLRPGQERAFSYQGTTLIETAMEVYQTFIEFVSDIQSGDELQPVQSLWSTYASDGYESVQYIEEHYATGVGIWSCPHPSIRSLDPASRDAVKAQRVFTYPCCNQDSEATSIPSSKIKAKLAFPNIPRNKGDVEGTKEGARAYDC